MRGKQVEHRFLSWDQVGSTPAKEVAVNGFRFLSSIQDVSRETQILGVAAVFLKMCNIWGVYPVDILQIVDNILTKNQHIPQFQAMDDYILNEL